MKKSKQLGTAELYLVLLFSLLSILMSSLLLNERLSLKRISLLKKEASEIYAIREKNADKLLQLDSSDAQFENFNLLALTESNSKINITNIFLQNSIKERLPNWSKLLSIQNTIKCDNLSLCNHSLLNLSQSSSFLNSLEVQDKLSFENLQNEIIYISIYGKLTVNNFLSFKNIRESSIHIIAKDDVFIAGIKLENVENTEILIHSSLKGTTIRGNNPFTQLSSSEFILTSSSIHSKNPRRNPEVWPMIRMLGESSEKS